MRSRAKPKERRLCKLASCKGVFERAIGSKREYCDAICSGIAGDAKRYGKPIKERTEEECRIPEERKAAAGPLQGCPVCKRPDSAPHDSWCTPERRAAAGQIDTPGPAPLIIRHTAPTLSASEILPFSQSKGVKAMSDEEAKTYGARGAASRERNKQERRAQPEPKPPMHKATVSTVAAPITEKACTQCQETKPIEAFPKTRGGGRARLCGVCYGLAMVANRPKRDPWELTCACGATFQTASTRKYRCDDCQVEANRKRQLSEAKRAKDREAKRLKAAAARGPLSPETRHCSACGEDQSVDLFQLAKNGDRIGICHPCKGKRVAAAHARRRETKAQKGATA